MKNLVIIGAGGMGREVYHLATQCNGYGVDFRVKGFLDDNLRALDRFSFYPPVIDRIAGYCLETDDVFACSIGNVRLKKECTEKIIRKGGEFISLIHPRSLINLTASLGVGCLVFPFAQVGADSVVGDFVLIQSYAIIAHDVRIGDFTRVDVQVLCVGGVVIGKQVTLHSGAIINHHVVIEDDAVAGAGSFVIRSVKQGCTVYGNPAKQLI